MTDSHDYGDLGALLDYLHERRNFDFRGYKQGSLSRRILKRMQTVGIDDFQRYTEVLEANPGEFGELFNTILINVTSLARDREAWQVLAESIIPAIIDGKRPEEPARIWSAGCARCDRPAWISCRVAWSRAIEPSRTCISSSSRACARRTRWDKAVARSPARSVMPLTITPGPRISPPRPGMPPGQPGGLRSSGQ